jgi:hypothetical protein
MDDFALRAIERILDAIIGGVSIYLGYRLFLSVPRRGGRGRAGRGSRAPASADGGESSAEFKLPGDASIILTRVGPGIFFALFGAAVVVTSLSKGMSYHHGPAGGGAGIAAPSAGGGAANAVNGGETDWHGYLPADKSGGGSTDWSGAVGADKANASPRLSRDRIVAERRDLAPQIAALNRIVPALKADIDPGRKADIELAIPAIKRTLMHPAWDADWGDEAAFDEWASNGASGTAPRGCEKAAQFFNQ